MSTEKSEKELKKEAGALIAKMQKNLDKLPEGDTKLTALKEKLKPFAAWQEIKEVNASMYIDALRKLNRAVDTAIQNTNIKESQSFPARFSKRATTLLQRQKVVNEQVSKKESEAKEVEAEQVAQNDDIVIGLDPEEANGETEEYIIPGDDTSEETDEILRRIFDEPLTDEETKKAEEDLKNKIKEREVEAEHNESESENETVAEMQEKLAAIERTKAKVEAVIKGENAPQPVESKEHNDESEQTEENIDEFAEMTKKTEEIQNLKSQRGETEPEVEQQEVESEGVTKATDAKEEHAAEEANEDETEEYIIPGDDVYEEEHKVEAGQNEDKGKEEIGSKQTVEPQTTNKELDAMRKNISEPEKRSQSPEFADFKDFATNALRKMGREGYANNYLERIENALVSGNVQDNENRYTQARTLLNDAAVTKNDIDKGGKLRGFTEALKTIAQEIQSPSQTVTKSNVTESFISIISKADSIVTAGARVQDQIADLRRDINVIKKQPEFEQFQKEHAQERHESMQDALKQHFPTTHKEPKQTEINASKPKLNLDQKKAYQAISKLDTLLERVEKSKVGIVKSILKGQVRNHLEAMNASPLKESIQKVGGLKTEKAEPSPSPRK